MRKQIKKSVRKLAVGTAACAIAASAVAAFADNLASVPDAEAAKAALIAFTRCDQSFFTSLAAKPQSFGPSVAVSTVGDVASPTVADPLSEKGRVQEFEKPVPVAGLKLIAYRNEVSYDAVMGAFLWWGFDVEGSDVSVVKAVNQMLKPDERMTKDGESWGRREYRRVGDQLGTWRRGGQGNGVVAEKGTVERVLSLEAHEVKGRVKLYCTLQGSVTAPLLQLARPDLPMSAQP